ncbi:MAG: DEAD/DEAH box helicase [Saprospiraceae bacterium]|nr:DEAD/DEAH box helicase [Saprospiraceae bacterium]
MNFSDLNLHPRLLDGIEALNYTTPTPIQAQAIPLILEGRDVVGIAQTGTGKTAAFILPIIDLILESGESDCTQALVIVPTRELAVQIDQMVEAYSYFTGVSSIAVYGGGDGKGFAQEKSAITGGVDIVIATPGRLMAHMKLGYVDFSKLRHLVLDEADRMLDMGFQADILRIIGACSPDRQSLLFSATMPDSVLRLANDLLRNPATVSIALSKPAEGVTQGAYVVHENQKVPLMVEMLSQKVGQRILVFSSTKVAVSTLFQKLRAKGLHVAMISSDLEQDAREQVMMAYKNRQVDILVATDVLSRGIDVDGIELVINYDCPRDAEDYVHRIGRTARGNKTGEALTLIGPEDQLRFKRIELLIGSQVPKLPLPEGIGPGPEYNPSAARREGGRSGGGDRKAHAKGRGHAKGPRPDGRAGGGEPKSEGQKSRRRKRGGGKKRSAEG